MGDKLFIVLPIRLNRSKQHIRKRVAGVLGILSITSKIVRSLGAIRCVVRCTACLKFKVNAGLERVGAFNPGKGVAHVVVGIGSLKGITAIKSKRRWGCNRLTSRCGARRAEVNYWQKV